MNAHRPLLSQRLRAETRSDHDMVEEEPFFRAVRANTLPRQSMVSYLRGLTIVHAVIETAFERGFGLDVAPWRHALTRADDLIVTLDAAGASGMPDVPRAIEAAIDWADAIVRDARSAPTLIGTSYVLEGSQLGGRVLRGHVAAALDMPEDRVAYFTADGDALDRHWLDVRRDLDALELDDVEAAHLRDAARRAYAGVTAIARAAFPYDDSELRHRVTAVNPEAGRHAMPQSDVEIARALRCAEAAWARFPYLAARFGERGRRFTNGDSCWLVSLYDADEAVVVRSLIWLREVLSSRGLPTTILETHLEAIDRDVTADDPARAVRATGMRAAVAHFRAERQAHLPADEALILVRRWQTRLDACSGAGSSDAAALLVAARLDTAVGIDRAWAQVRAWFQESARFSPKWIATVEELAEALDESISTKMS
ncbi:MAG: biliverdin-producing heme oxygenase [Trueperaceae bacterium]|nr:biliverdin-producing heme oxygenase [Trueperaceae bacterium]